VRHDSHRSKRTLALSEAVSCSSLSGWLRSDRAGQLSECLSEAGSGRSIGPEVVEAPAEVLNEGMAGHDDPSSGIRRVPYTAVAMDEYLRANRRLWDAWTDVHVRSAFYDVASFLPGGNREIRIKDYELDEVGDVRGKKLLHLQCHFGLETLSWARLGATATGVDFSERAIDEARRLTVEVGLEAEATFVRSDLYELPENLDPGDGFDVVYTSHGVLGWLPDIERWATVAARFVRPGGFLYLTEIHPVAMAFENVGVQPGELLLRYPYWSHAEPISLEAHGSYADPDAPTPGLTEHGWDHSLGEIVTALANAGLHVEFLHEFPFVLWKVDFAELTGDGRFHLPGELDGRLPLYFSLKASKPAGA
jgi:SAM-dependent methyltransferase